MKIFGQEPAAWAGVLQGILGVLVVLHAFGVNGDLATLIQAAAGAVFALAMAFYTKKVNLAVVIGAAQTVMALLVGFGIDGLSPELQGAIIAGLQFALAGFLRQNTEPAERPSFRNEVTLAA